MTIIANERSPTEQALLFKVLDCFQLSGGASGEFDVNQFSNSSKSISVLDMMLDDPGRSRYYFSKVGRNQFPASISRETNALTRMNTIRLNSENKPPHPSKYSSRNDNNRSISRYATASGDVSLINPAIRWISAFGNTMSPENYVTIRKKKNFPGRPIGRGQVTCALRR